jgi:hypothetical protein
MPACLDRPIGAMACVAVFVWFPAAAQVPNEVQGLNVAATTLTWQAEATADDYNLYRGTLADLAAGAPPRCHGDEIVATSFSSPQDPAPGEGFVYLVTAEAAGGEGSAGLGPDGGERPLTGHCDAVARTHVVGRIGYGSLGLGGQELGLV